MELNIQYAITAVIILTTIVVGFFYYRSLKRLKQVMGMAAELFFINQTLEQSLGIEQSEEALDIHKEDFIKFLSDSRDWAFEYIEEVQKGLNSFITEVEQEIEYYNNYGAALDGMISPHDKALKKISKEFEKLKALLPEDKNDGR
jgi:hypothetical protein